MRVVSREGVTGSLSDGTIPGFIRMLILAWVRVWGYLCGSWAGG
jgi:hypothetical protein